MAITGDILAILDKLPIWKRVQETPGRVDELERRVADLERRLERAPGEACPKCGALALRLDRAGGIRGGHANRFRKDDWKCQDCGHVDERMVNL